MKPERLQEGESDIVFDVTPGYYRGYVHLYFHLERNRTKHHHRRMVVQMGHLASGYDDAGEVHLGDMLVVDAYAAGGVHEDAYVYMVDIE